MKKLLENKLKTLLLHYGNYGNRKYLILYFFAGFFYKKKPYSIYALFSIFISRKTASHEDKLLIRLLPLRKIAQKRVLGNPTGLTIINGKNPGELIPSVTKVPYASTYNFMYTSDAVPTDASIWVTKSCSTVSCLITGLQAGSRYWFRIFVVGTKGQVAWGETIQSPVVQP
jgi:hypothetical protein